MNFGLALALLLDGKRVARTGWNGKGMFIYYVGPGRYQPSTPAGQAIAEQNLDHLVPYKPYLAIRCVDGEVVPWLASQTDILAMDWENLDEEVEADGDTTVHPLLPLGPFGDEELPEHLERALAKCMGGNFCSHMPGRCTAYPPKEQSVADQLFPGVPQI